MKAHTLYRIAAILFVLFAAGHTFGFLTFRPPNAEGLAVMNAMDRVHFTVGSATFSYGAFYRGFGLNITFNLLFYAFLAWHLSGTARKTPTAVGALGWVFFGMQVVGFVLSLQYFSIGPAISSAIVAICLGWAALATPKSINAGSSPHQP